MRQRMRHPVTAIAALVVLLCSVVVFVLAIVELHPPTWMREAATTFIIHIAQPMYWFLALISLLAYLVLLWQKRLHETYAAQALRWFQVAKMCVWLSLAIGRSFGEWRFIMFALAATYVAVMGSWWLIALYLTYVRPARHRSVAVVEEVLPAYTGTERRSGIERRAGWRNVSE